MQRVVEDLVDARPDEVSPGEWRRTPKVGLTHGLQAAPTVAHKFPRSPTNWPPIYGSAEVAALVEVVDPAGVLRRPGKEFCVRAEDAGCSLLG